MLAGLAPQIASIADMLDRIDAIERQRRAAARLDQAKANPK